MLVFEDIEVLLFDDQVVCTTIAAVQAPTGSCIIRARHMLKLMFVSCVKKDSLDCKRRTTTVLSQYNECR